MSKLEEMINTLCPNGVEYKLLGELCEIEKGKQLNKESLLQFGKYPVINGGINPSGFWNEFNFDKNLITISQGGASAGYVNYITTDFWAGAHCYVLVNPKYEINYRLLYHIIKQYEKELMSSQVGAGIPSVSSNKLSSLKIPVPPIEVQLEIVRILDNFTELTSELIAKLSEECSKIKKQYEYLKDKCLDFNGKITTKRFGELAHIVRGASPRPIHTFITEKSDGINWIKIGDVKAGNKYITETKEKINKIGASKSRIVKEGDFLLSNSMSFGRPYISAIDGCIHDGWLAISNFESTFTRDFLYHLLSSTKIQRILAKKASFGGAVQNLNADIVRSIELPIPPYAEQKRIAAILDQLDELYNSITKNILTEIEARKKQYEYYRDKLLTFKELS